VRWPPQLETIQTFIGSPSIPGVRHPLHGIS
jgi:hypothetical protein